MKFNRLKILLLSGISIFPFLCYGQVFLPIHTYDRSSPDQIRLTDIGVFGLWRKERANVPGHYHTGIDIRRPGQNYTNEPIYPISFGTVISVRNDGPYAQIIIEHNFQSEKYWTVYEHIAEIKVIVGDEADPMKPVARFMNKNELNRYGWQFDHVHLEILKQKPLPLAKDENNPMRYFNSYSLICYTKQQLLYYFYDPLDFLSRNL